MKIPFTAMNVFCARHEAAMPRRPGLGIKTLLAATLLANAVAASAAEQTDPSQLRFAVTRYEVYRDGELVGSPNDLGDAVGTNDKAFGEYFPYVALPNDGSAQAPTVNNSAYSPLEGGADAANAASAGVPTDGISPVATGLVALGFLAMVGGAVMFGRSSRATAQG